MHLKQSRALALTAAAELAALSEIGYRLSRENHGLALRVEAVESNAQVQQALLELLDDVDRRHMRAVMGHLAMRIRQIRTHQRAIASALADLQFTVRCSIPQE